jgi:hypothetical protein
MSGVYAGVSKDTSSSSRSFINLNHPQIVPNKRLKDGLAQSESRTRGGLRDLGTGRARYTTSEQLIYD